MTFEEWWDKHGQFCRAGGGEYEMTFAFRAWNAATNVERSACLEDVRTVGGKFSVECEALISARPV